MRRTAASASSSEAALQLAGYGAENRYLVFQCLRHTLDFPNEKWHVLDQAHRKRNVAEYESAADVDESLMEALIWATEEVAARVLDLRAGSVPDEE